MSPPSLAVPPIRSIIGVVVVTGAFALTAGFLFVPSAGHARDAAIALLTLAWSQASHVVRSLFKSEDGKP